VLVVLSSDASPAWDPRSGSSSCSTTTLLYYLGVARHSPRRGQHLRRPATPRTATHPLWCWAWCLCSAPRPNRGRRCAWAGPPSGCARRPPFPPRLWWVLRPRTGPAGRLWRRCCRAAAVAPPGPGAPNGLETPLYAL
jgi:hypothetical protein